MSSAVELVNAAIAQVLEKDKDYPPETKIRDIADSLELMLLVLRLEERLCITIPDETVGKMKTIGDIIGEVGRAQYFQNKT